jgi:peptide/nickel transport system ATP-binding protein
MEGSEAQNLLNIQQLSVEYNAQGSATSRILALDQVSMKLPSGGYTLGVVGESGSGKTTLGLSIMNLIEPPGRIGNGRVEFEGVDVLRMEKESLRKYRWEKVAMVYQSAMNSMNPVKSVSHPIAEVLKEHAHYSSKEARDRALGLLSQVGITSDRVDDFPHEFSGGMRQRVVIAQALALSPKLLIADEPTSALDVVVQQEILRLLEREMTQRGLSLIFITHEIALLSDLVDNVAVMYAGEIVESGPIDRVLFEPLHPYTEMLLDSMMTLDAEKKDLASYSRSAVKESGHSLPVNACKYSNRCKYAFDRCRVERPILKEEKNGRLVACHKYN